MSIINLVSTTRVKLTLIIMTKFDRKIPYDDLPMLPSKADIKIMCILRKTISE